MGLITDIFFGIANFFKWIFENTLVPIGHVADWLLFIVGMVLMGWWLYKLVQFGNDHEKDYEGW
jgi:hypothetical protein